MNYKLFNVAVPIRANNVVLVDGLVQYDTANIVNVRLMDGVDPFDFTGWTHILLEILKPDGSVITTCVGHEADISAEDASDIIDKIVNDSAEAEEAVPTPSADDLNKNNNPYTIQVLEPTEGRISFTLKDQATILSGTHFMRIVVMGGGEKLSTAKVNYYVGDVMIETLPDMTSSNDYSAFSAMLLEMAKYVNSERARADAEADRMAAEDMRAEQHAEVYNHITNYLNNAVDYVNQTLSYMEAARGYAEFAQNPSREAMSELIGLFDLITSEQVASDIAVAVKEFDAGFYSDSDDERKKSLVRRGDDADLPELESGEFGWSEDSETVYIGGLNGNVPLNGVFVAAESAPERTDIIWIDTASGNSLKYYDGTSWVAAASATFS